ncbi:MAG TPA: choice-of-anchor D domain-containing protein [Terriglobales bacterium]|nr:choice-of-anchor D domain-containing protein [Terriglobales bacterium]
MINCLTSLRLAGHSTVSRTPALISVLLFFSIASFGQHKTESVPADSRVSDRPTLSASPKHSPAVAFQKVPSSPAEGTVSASAVSTISAALGAHDTVYAIHADGRTLAARNSRQRLDAKFSPNGVVLASGNASLRMKLAGYGSGDATVSVHDVRPIARDNRIEYRHGPLTEWYVNGPAGLEQGFTLHAPPGRQRAGELQIALSYSGELQPELDKNGEALVLKRRDGRTALRYAGLEAHDADGHPLHASLQLRGNSIRLVVDDRAARYPVVVDPLFQAAILTASNGTKTDAFGVQVAVSLDGNTIVVGAQNSANREAYVFEKQGTAWTSMTEVRRLSDPDSEGIGPFAISGNGDTIVSDAVNVQREDVFVRPGTSWSGSTDKLPDASLTRPSDLQNSQLQGVAISEDGSTAVVGASNTGFSGTAPWQILVFLRPGDTWSGAVDPAATLTGSDPTLSLFGGEARVAIAAGRNVIVGNANIAPDGDDTVGELLVFIEPEDGWTSKKEDATLKPNNSTTDNAFGRAVAIDNNGDTIVAGDAAATVNSHVKQGEAYVFVQPEAGWTSTNTPNATLFDASGATGDAFGAALTMSGDARHILVGVPDALAVGPGHVSAFDMPTDGWTGTLSAPENFTANDSATEFGLSLSISGNGGVAVIGQLPQNQIGEAYVFTPCVSLNPQSFGFGNVLVGSSSPPETFTLLNSCATEVTNVAITFQDGGDGAFSQNNNCGSILPGNASCDIDVVFAPLEEQEVFVDALQVADSDTSSSPQSAVVTGTGVCGVSLAPGSLDFGSVNVGSSSPPKAFTLSNQCTTDVTGVAISFSGANSADFSQNNNCGGTIPAGSSCTINVTFAPTTGAVESATLVVVDNDPASPQQAALTGTGLLSGDFTITPTDAEPPTTPGSATSATVASGSPATYAFSLKTPGGFNSAVTLTAAFIGPNQPAGTNFTFDVNPVTPTSSGVTSTLTVSTSPPHAFAMLTGSVSRYAVGLITFPLALFGMAWLPVSVKTRRRAFKSSLLLCAVCAVLFASSCASPTRPPGTGAGTYQIEVTATGGGITHTANVTLVVQ